MNRIFCLLQTVSPVVPKFAYSIKHRFSTCGSRPLWGSNDVLLGVAWKLSVKEHIQILENKISQYFPNLPATPFALARSPFTVKVEDAPENAQEEFIELINSDAAKTDFSSKSISQFWIGCLQTNHPILSEIVLRLLLPFPTTYLYETGFSSLLTIKSKYRSRLLRTMIFVVLLQKLFQEFQFL